MAELQGNRAHATGGPMHDVALALGDPPGGAVEVPGRRPLDDQRKRGAVLEPVGNREDVLGGCGRVLGVAARADQSHHALAGVLADARHLAARDERERRLLDVGVRARMRVGEVHAGPCHLDQDLPRARDGDRQLGARGHLRATELGHLDGAHASRLSESRGRQPRGRGRPAVGRASHGRGALRCAPMPITVVGSIAFDSVKTPFGERERMLGGAAVHFALAASFFDDVCVVGPVGDDFGDEELAVMRRRSIDVSDVERIPGGRTFFWRGEYGWDLNSRETLDTQLGVFQGFQPKLSERSRASDVLFLANIQPELQRDVRAQLPQARFVALDSMNLWIDIARDSLVAAIESVDCLILNDAELRQLTGRPNLVGAAREILDWGGEDAGPSVIVAKQGEYGAALVTRERLFTL